MKRKISEIMNDMDNLENFEISEEAQEKLREHFKHEIAREKLEKSKTKKENNKKVASGYILTMLNRIVMTMANRIGFREFLRGQEVQRVILEW